MRSTVAATSAEDAGATPSTRQWLTERQSETVDALLDAGHEALAEVGLGALSLRDVARRAGVTHTTAYNYFTSKEHLVAELHWRLLRRVPLAAPDPDAPLGERLTEALRGASGALTEDPSLAEAALAALVGRDPEIARIRDSIGAEIRRRLQVVGGDELDDRMLDGVLLLHSGAMLQAGLGYLTFDEVVGRIADIVDLWGRPDD